MYKNSQDEIFIRKMRNTDKDYNLILKWYKNPVVTEYFTPIIKTKEEAIEKYLPRIIGDSKVVSLIIEQCKNPIGYMQYYPIENEDIKKFGLQNYNSVYGIDIFIGEKNLYSKGIGSKSLKILISYLFSNKKAKVIIIDPETRNEIAINCYKKAGFTPHLKISDEGKEKLIMLINGRKAMKNLKLKQLNFKNVMFSMAIIMLVWSVVWYPFYYFVFPKDLSITMSNLIGLSCQYLRMLSAVLFFIYYKEWLGPEFELEKCKSQYLLINLDRDIEGYEKKGSTEFGYLYEKRKLLD